MKSFILQYAWLIPIIPGIGALINGVFGRPLQKKIGEKVNGYLGCLTIFISFLFALMVFKTLLGLPEEERSFTITLFNWISVGNFNANISYLFDPLSSVMILVVTGVGFLIHVYSIGYMSKDPGYSRYFAFLNLFCFMMLNLVLGDNILLMFLGWEGVGLCSYLLIGFWFTHYPNTTAGNKAFLVNRIGDWGFIIGFFLLFWTLGSQGAWGIEFTSLQENIHLIANAKVIGISVITLVCLLFFVGATGKSAQIPLYVWLPDAMAGPTPVSALIHAATMVTAGVYMIGRLNFMFVLSETALMVVAVVGTLTALIAAIIGFAQNDIKKVLAYSTVSQLGYMFMGMGTGAFSAGIFHLMTHAFFKALLFMGAGSVIVAMHHQQDVRKMGGLRKYIPWTFGTFILAYIAICGIFPFAGFFSKDEILWNMFSSSHGNKILWFIGLVAAGMTAFYMTRLVILTFFGKKRWPTHDGHELHVKENPVNMIGPLFILGILSLIGGWIGWPEAIGGSNHFHHFLSSVFVSSHGEAVHHYSHAFEIVLMIVSIGIALAGAFLGYYFYHRRPDLPGKCVAKAKWFYQFVYNKYYVDEVYDKVFVRGTINLTKISKWFDDNIVDGLVNLSAWVTKIYAFFIGWFDNTFVDGLVNLTSNSFIWVGSKVKKIQTGKIQNYAYVLFVGVVLIIIIRLIT